MCLRQSSLQQIYVVALEGAWLEHEYVDLGILENAFVFDFQLAEMMEESVETWLS